MEKFAQLSAFVALIATIYKTGFISITNSNRLERRLFTKEENFVYRFILYVLILSIVVIGAFLFSGLYFIWLYWIAIIAFCICGIEYILIWFIGFISAIPKNNGTKSFRILIIFDKYMPITILLSFLSLIYMVSPTYAKFTAVNNEENALAVLGITLLASFLAFIILTFLIDRSKGNDFTIELNKVQWYLLSTIRKDTYLLGNKESYETSDSLIVATLDDIQLKGIIKLNGTIYKNDKSKV
ncbi:MAG: hypothetical protein CVV02_00975 [Firmicutes bacterium HGW-Firmicutes-7]|nr:MAG: hypothetical protein CVV02_00975 [Firmicutes bacterium HGW-Firmicutes-7]